MAKKKKQKSIAKELPEVFVERLEKIVGTNTAVAVENMCVERPTTFRVNLLRSTKKEVDTWLKEHHIKTVSVPWYPEAYVLVSVNKRAFTEMDIYTQGKVYIQSLASMVPPIVLNPQAGETILDLTAAPGSKTSQIAMMMQQQGTLIANDMNKVRFFKLKHNMEHLGVVNEEKEDWHFQLRMEDGAVLSREYPAYFDKILLDTPCSAEARFINGDPKTYGYWSEQKIKKLAYEQTKLILAAWSALKPGGTLVYSTCTFAPEENEARISKLLERVGSEAQVEKITMPGLKLLAPVSTWKEKTYHPEVKKTLRIFPTKDIEGFFIAKIKKKV